MKLFRPLTLAACLMSSSCAYKAPLAPPMPAAAKAAGTDQERKYYEAYGREFERERREKETSPPRMGMTRAQVRAEYGRPTSIISNPRGETWTYSFNGTDARLDSPFHDTSASVRCTVNFSVLSGKVVSWQWTAANPVLRGGYGGYGGGY